MNIAGVTNIRSGLISSFLQTLAQPTNLRRARASSLRKPSQSGPAFLLGGGANASAAGLYNSLGRLLSPNAQQGAATSPSPADEKRITALKEVAARINSGDPQGGRALAQKILDRRPTDITAIRLVARSFLAERNYIQAQRQLARAAALAPGSKRLAGERDNAALLQRSDDEVIAAARRKMDDPNRRKEGLRLLAFLTDRSPSSSDAFLALADGFAAVRRPQQVVGALQEALRHAEGTTIDAVITRATTLVEQHPRSGIAHNLLGRALEKAGRLDEAVRELQAAADRAPFNVAYRRDLADVHVVRARQDLESRRLEAAAVDLQTARKLDPLNPNFRDVTSRLEAERARRIILRGNPGESLVALQRAALNAPQDGSFRRTLADLHLQVGKHFENNGSDTQALTLFRKALELDPGSSIARRRVAQVSQREGLAALNANDLDRAVDLLQLSYDTQRIDASIGQDLARALDLRGQQRLALGKINDAITDFKAGLAVDPTNPSLTSDFAKAVAL